MANKLVSSTELEQLQNATLDKIKLLGKIKNLDSNIIKNLGQWMRMELTYTSNALEGNTLTRKETKLVVEEGLSVGGKSIVEILEVKNHSKALELVELLATEYSNKLSVKNDKERININTLLKIHSKILQGIDDQNAGRFRNVPVRISGSATILPNYLKVPILIDQMIEEINNWDKQNIQSSISDLENQDKLYLDKSSQENPLKCIDLAIKAHYDLVTIHPFIDGNGRTARLLFNLVLLQNDLPIVFIAKEDRSQYLSALEKAQNGGSNQDYYSLMYRAVIRSLDLYLDQINNIDSIELKSVESTLLKIGQLAKQSNESVANIRYWTSLGLLKVYNTTATGYALYHTDCIGVIRQIRFLQTEKRMSLGEIAIVIK